SLPGAFQLLPYRFNRDGIMEQRKHLQQSCFIERSENLPVGNFQKEVEVIGHQTVSDHPHPREGLLIAQDLPENLLVFGFEYPAPVHHARHDMVKGTAFAEQSRGSHAVRMEREMDFGKRNLIDCLSLKCCDRIVEQRK